MEKKPKILKLKKAQKDKRRYFVINSESQKEIEKALQTYLGILGLAKARYMHVTQKTIKKGIVGSCVREELNNVRTALTLADIEITKVANTIKGLSK